MNALAIDLGIEFKTSKDEGITTPRTTIEFLGILISTEPTVQAMPSPTKL
jgi:hypothetical protein